MCIFSSAPPAPTPPPPVPTKTDDEVAAEIAAERRRGVNAAGREDTILTGGSGVTGTANSSKKTLLGGVSGEGGAR
jgi:hypothetical protein